MRVSSTAWVSGSNGQLLTHSNHLGTAKLRRLDGEIHFFTPGKDIASLQLNEFLVGPGVVVDLSDCTGDYQIYTSQNIEERVEVREGDILIIHTGYHHFGWDQPYADEVRYMVQHPGPDREFAEWAKAKKLRWIGVDCGSADHPMNTIIRNWMPRQAAEADKLFRETFGHTTLEERFTPDRHQLMHLEMFPYHIVHAECIGGDVDLLCNRRATIGFSRSAWRFVDGESCIGRCVAFVDDAEYEELTTVPEAKRRGMARKAGMAKTRLGDGYEPEHVERIEQLTKRF